MPSTQNLAPLLEPFTSAEQKALQEYIARYDQLLRALTAAHHPAAPPAEETGGIPALNGASGAGQSYVLERVEKLLRARGITLPRIYLLATRPPRPGEGYKNPYIFVQENEIGFQDIFHPETVYRQKDIYYFYESRPGAANAILLADARAALQRKMYLETVIPTLLHIKTTPIGDIPAWGSRLTIVYLAVPGGAEWLSRLLGREPEKLADAQFRTAILGRVTSSIKDMEIAAQHKIPTVLNRYMQGERAAREILQIWGL